MSLLLLFGGGSGAEAPELSFPGVALDDAFLELALHGSYYEVVLAAEPIAMWMLNEMRHATGARDISGNELHGDDYESTLVLGTFGPFPHGGTAVQFPGVSGFIEMGDLPELEFSGAFSIEGMFRATNVSGVGTLIGKQFVADDAGWSVMMTATGAIRFFAETAASASVFDVTTDEEYDDGEWHHFACAWDGNIPGAGGGGFPLLFGRRLSSTGPVGKAKIYIDGVLVKQSAAVAGTIAQNGARVLIGARDSAGVTQTNFFSGFLSGIAVFDRELTPTEVLTHFQSTQWTDVGADAVRRLRLDYGTTGSGPLDRMSNAGTLEFFLDNSAYNSVQTPGYYSPLHESCRVNFGYDVPVRVRLVYSDVPRTKFWGRLLVIDPMPGVNRDRVTHCIAHDYSYMLNDADIRSVDPEVDQSETQLLRAVFEAMPYDVQPMGVDLDASVDTYKYAFDDLQGGRKATTVLRKILISSWGRGFVKGDGTFCYRNRSATTNQVIDFALDDSQILELESPSDMTAVFDRVRAITHDKDIDTGSPLTDIFVHPGIPFVEAGETIEIWGEYRNPNNDLQTVGGLDVQTPNPGTDIVAFENDDGTGTDLSGDLTVTFNPFASTFKLTVENTHATLGAYLTFLRVQGRGIYDRAPVTSEAISGRGKRPITVDLPYQNDANIGQEIADYILRQRESITDPVEQISIDPHHADTMMLLSLDGEPGTLLTVSEEQTGLDGAQASVRSVHLELSEGLIMSASFGLTPIFVGFEWILGDPNFSVLGETTVVG